MIIESAHNQDLGSIKKIIESAFSEEENTLIFELASSLLSEKTNPPIISHVAIVNDHLVGYVSYSPIFLNVDCNLSGYILSPLAVSKEYQSKGIGTALIRTGIEILSNQLIDFLLVYGDPSYYQKFGFREELGRSFLPPFPLKYPSGWMGMMLNQGDSPKTSIQCECVPPLNRSELW